MSKPLIFREPDPLKRNTPEGFLVRPLVAESMEIFRTTGSYKIPPSRIEEIAPSFHAAMREFPELVHMTTDPEVFMKYLGAAVYLAANRAEEWDFVTEIDLMTHEYGGFDGQI